MAEIEIERKRRSVWPWVLLGLVVLALVAWWFMAQPADRTDQRTLAPDTAPLAAYEPLAGAGNRAASSQQRN